MKIIIERDGVKRELLAPFAMCMSKADLAALRDQLDLALAVDNFHYGWFEVWPRPEQRSNTTPLPWAGSDSK